MSITSALRYLSFLTAAVAGLTNARAEDGWLTPHAFYSFDITSCYISRGKVYEDRPIQVNEVDINLALEKFGRIGFNHWNYSCLTGAYQDKYRRFMPETDWAPYYEFDLPFSSEWKLTTQLMAMWKTYYGGKPSSDPSSFEWRLKQTLKNPYVTPYYKIHYNVEPEEWWYYQIGVNRKFEIFDGFTLTPCVSIDFANGQGRIKRFGKRDDGSRYGAGVLSMIAELTAEYRFTDWLSVHASVGQFGIIDSAGRDNIDDPPRRDLTYWQAGAKVEF